MVDLIEMYVHWDAGRSQAQIADSLGIDRKTVRKYLAPVAAAGLVPGGPPVMSEAGWRDRAAAWFPEVVDKGLRQVTWPAIGAHRDYITGQLPGWCDGGYDPSAAGRRARPGRLGGLASTVGDRQPAGGGSPCSGAGAAAGGGRTGQ